MAELTTIAITPEVRDRVRIAAALTGKTMREITEEAIDRLLAELPGQQYLIPRSKDGEATP